MSQSKATLASMFVAGLVVAGGAGAALTANADTTSPTPSASASATPGQQQGQPDGQQGRPAMHQHTAATAAETTSVKAAVKAKDSTITVEKVEKDPDGSFDAWGTRKASSGTGTERVRVEVSKDLKTVTVDEHGPRGDHGPGGHHGTPASDAETTQVKAAVKAKDSTITVEHVMKESDGSFCAMGTKAGSTTGDGHVMVQVSKDLKTVTVDTKGPRDGHGPRGDRQGNDQQGQQSQGSQAQQGQQSSIPQPSASASKPA